MPAGRPSPLFLGHPQAAASPLSRGGAGHRAGGLWACSPQLRTWAPGGPFFHLAGRGTNEGGPHRPTQPRTQTEVVPLAAAGSRHWAARDQSSAEVGRPQCSETEPGGAREPVTPTTAPGGRGLHRRRSLGVESNPRQVGVQPTSPGPRRTADGQESHRGQSEQLPPDTGAPHPLCPTKVGTQALSVGPTGTWHRPPRAQGVAPRAGRPQTSAPANHSLSVSGLGQVRVRKSCSQETRCHCVAPRPRWADTLPTPASR